MESTEGEVLGRIVVYSIVGCPHCLKAKSTIKEQGLSYTEVGVDRFPAEVREWLSERTGKTSVPQIFFNAKYIGGNEQLQSLVADEDKWAQEVRELSANPPPADDSPSAPLLPNPGTAIDIPTIDGAEADSKCEMDDYAPLVQEMQKAGLIKAHRIGCGGRVGVLGSKVKDSFVGKEFVDWAVDKKRISREKAIFMGKQLVSRKFGTSADNDQDFRDDHNAVYKLATSDCERALNTAELSKCAQRPATEVAEEMRKLILRLYGQFLSDDGSAVDYKGIGQSAAYKSYKKLTLELQRSDIASLSPGAKLAFFINVYNALVIHGTVEQGRPGNMYSRYKFFANTAYSIGGHIFSLNDIENGILRANSRSFGTLYIRPFGEGDPRLSLALERAEPRIHFALNCGAKSCPPIKTYSADSIEDELDLATASFLENPEGVDVDAEGEVVVLSKLFQWYRADFGESTNAMVKWVKKRVKDETKRKAISEFLRKANDEDRDVKVRFLPYDWGDNEKKD